MIFLLRDLWNHSILGPYFGTIKKQVAHGAFCLKTCTSSNLHIYLAPSLPRIPIQDQPEHTPFPAFAGTFTLATFLTFATFRSCTVRRSLFCNLKQQRQQQQQQQQANIKNIWALNICNGEKKQRTHIDLVSWIEVGEKCKRITLLETSSKSLWKSMVGR